jgi:hypothetical protein
MSESVDTIHCEVCDLAHRRGAERCDRCEHVLGTMPDWQGLRAELPGLRRKIALGVVVLVAMLALNVMFFGGAGYVVLLAPIGWILFGAYRHWVLSEQLHRAPPDSR